VFLSLGIHEYMSGYWWRSPRYRDWGLQFLDFALAMLAGSILLPRLAWLGIGELADLVGRHLSGSGLRRWDFWTLAVPAVFWAYLLYVANAEDAPFWPLAMMLAAGWLSQHRGLFARREGALLSFHQAAGPRRDPDHNPE
jgi:hypothetical protein